MREILASFLLLLGIGAAQKSIPQSNFREVDLSAKITLARTIWGEARGEGYEGMQSVANVVMNRLEIARNSVAKARQFGGTVDEICKKPYQFSAWNVRDPNFAKMMNVTENDQAYTAALEIADRALRGTLPDITGGADHYHTQAVNPSWSRGETVIAQIGAHNFFKLG